MSNRITKVVRKYEKQKPGIDAVRRANAEIRRQNKLRRRKVKVRKGDVRVEMVGEAASGTTISDSYSREALEAMTKPDLIKIGKVYKIKRLSILKKDYIIGEILAAQSRTEVVDD